MTISLDDLMPSQRRLLARICGNDEPQDAIGRELSEMTDSEIITAQTMMALGLLDIVEGWRGTGWLMLTEAGQRLLEEGLRE